MITSNEPAYYEVGSFGIRIESVLFVKKVENAKAGNWLQFEKLTRVRFFFSSSLPCAVADVVVCRCRFSLHPST